MPCQRLTSARNAPFLSIRSLACCAVLFVFTLSHPQARGDQAISADSFVDTAGVNVHLSFWDTPYRTNFPGVLSALQGLGVRHVRDGLYNYGADASAYYYQQHDSLAGVGISTIYSVPINTPTSLVVAYPNLVTDFEGYEGPNEYDLSGDPDWASNLTVYQTLLYQTVRYNPTTAMYPVLGPSLVNSTSWPQVSSLATYMDFGNLHNYYAGYNPGTTTTSGIPTAIQNLQAGWGSVPIITTETGYIYQDYMSIAYDIGGTYMPRVLLEQYLNGILRTYDYELVDIQSDHTQYGLLTADLTPRPAYTAMANLLNLLSDPGPVFALTSLGFTLNGDTTNVNHLLMQKRDGSFWLALWIESQDYDQVNQLYLSVPNQPITLSVPAFTSAPTVYQFDSSGNITTSSLPAGSSFPLSVSPNVMIVQIIPPGTPLSTTSGAASLSPAE
jgi:hypothetical protein